MSFFRSFSISGSALTAQRIRMDVIAQNIANATTTRTANGTTYRRRVVVFSPQEDSSFAYHLNQANRRAAGGVKVTAIMEDPAPLKRMYDPTHPDADGNGYVTLPNVDITKEMIDMLSATRAYEANVTALNATKAMALKALEIGR